MKTVFVLGYVNTQTDKNTGVWGEEVVARNYLKYMDADIRTHKDIIESGDRYDMAIYMTYNTLFPWNAKKIADKNVLWIQGFNYDKQKNVLDISAMAKECSKYYDVITSSRKLAKEGYPFVLPAVDFDEYKPVVPCDTYYHDIVYIGNIIKSHDITSRYISPLGKFNYGLYGGDFGKITHDEWLKYVCSAKLNLHFGFQEGIEWDMVTGRPLFISACKGVTVCDRIPWFEETFGDSFIFTDGGADEEERISKYLNNESERRNKAEEAYRIVKSLDYNLPSVLRSL